MSTLTTLNTTVAPTNASRISYGFPSHETVIVASIFYGLIACFAVFGNLLVVISFLINDKLRTVTNYFVVGLAGADILVGAVSVPLWMYLLYLYGSQQPTSDTIEKFYKSLDQFAGISSILHLMAISVERYFCVGWAIKHRNTPRYVYYIALVLVWVISAVAASIRPIAPKMKDLDLVILTFVVFFLLPLVIIVISYAAIWKIATTRMNNNPSKRSLKREIRTATTIAFVIGFFFISWTPFFVSAIVNVYCPMTTCPFSWSALLLFKFLHFSNSAVNPVVYGVRIPEFRKTFKFILRRIYGPILALCGRH